jgi:hypothetical protein
MSLCEKIPRMHEIITRKIALIKLRIGTVEYAKYLINIQPGATKGEQPKANHRQHHKPQGRSLH